MEITDEIIGCYIEDTATPEERIQVREHLFTHSAEHEHILCLMDNDTADFALNHHEKLSIRLSMMWEELDM